MKNLRGKTVKREQAYEVYRSHDWMWYVLKHYAAREREIRDPFARVFCCVTSPYVGERGELGDVYLAEITGQAHLVTCWCPACGAQVKPLIAGEARCCAECAGVLP